MFETNVVIATVIAVLISYALGSIPTGLWLGLWLRGIDIREHGSKNIGATNTLRVLGKTLGIIALVGDMLKGLAPVLVVARLSSWEYAPLACGLAAIVGHTASVFCKFKGGKGVATSTGVFAALCPWPFAAAFVVFFAVVLTTRMVSAASISAAATLAIAVFFFPTDAVVQAITVAVAVLVIVKHRGNIQRILKGEESKVF